MKHITMKHPMIVGLAVLLKNEKQASVSHGLADGSVRTVGGHAPIRGLSARRATRLRSVVYGRNEGLSRLQASHGFWPGALRGPDGNLWFAMESGVAEVSTQYFKISSLISASSRNAIWDWQACARASMCPTGLRPAR